MEVGTNNSQEYEWQMYGQDEWMFGIKIRGIVRNPLAEIYFDDEKNYGWIWLLLDGTEKRGVEPNLQFAIKAAEEALKIT